MAEAAAARYLVSRSSHGTAVGPSSEVAAAGSERVAGRAVEHIRRGLRSPGLVVVLREAGTFLWVAAEVAEDCSTGY